MSFQAILGPSGAGKSYQVYDRVIKESIDNPDTNYIILVPEQYSMAIQKKMVMMHPGKGTLNIDVIGFNRLSYRIFDELNIKSTKVLEDFGKSMLIRKVAGDVRDDLKIFKGCLDKPGFIDEVKSLMSEFYQYDVSHEDIHQLIDGLTDEADSLLADKLKDMALIFDAFDEKIQGEYIVAEQITELLADNIDNSALIKKSVIIMDGFTGFTPIQNKIISKLLVNAKDIFAIFTIDKGFYEKQIVKEHELFYLTKKTLKDIKKLARDNGISVKDDIFIDANSNGRFKASEELAHLEANIFRYPYKKYTKAPADIFVSESLNPRQEIKQVAIKINELVMNEGYRYKDIAIISGNLENMVAYFDQTFPMYDISYFLDYRKPVKNNPYIDSFEHLLKIVRDNFSYESVFALLKSGIIESISFEAVCDLENYCLKKGIKHASRWNRTWKEFDEERKLVVNEFDEFYQSLKGDKKKVSDYVSALFKFIDSHDYEAKLNQTEGLYDKVISVFDKLLEIMPEDMVSCDEFIELLNVGFKDFKYGNVPGKLDMVTIGDITRTRLEDIKILFIVGMNDGIIPKSGQNAQIISDDEKERISSLGILVAPTEKQNSYIEQFYIYTILSKTSKKLYISYTKMNASNESLRPSYVISRICNLFPKLKINYDDSTKISTYEGSVEILIDGIKKLMEDDNSQIEQTLSLYKIYMDMGDTKLLEIIRDAFTYNNIPKSLTKDVADLINLRTLSQSVSRLETYAKCAYQYYLRYILRLSDRKIFEISNLDIGNIMHFAMEQMYRFVFDNLDNDANALSDNERDELIASFVKTAFVEEYGEDSLDEGEYEHLLKTLTRIGIRTVKTLFNKDYNDALKPSFFEYKFKKDLLVKDGKTVSLTGVVDRADVYYSKENNELRLRVVDYKSSSHEFVPSHLYEGLDLQLSVYLNIMLEFAKDVYSKDFDNVNVIPDGMYYYHMQDPYVENTDETKVEKERDKKLKYKGQSGTDQIVIDTSMKYAMKKTNMLIDEIMSGIIQKKPMVKDGTKTCDYCDYKSICRFDEKYGGNTYRYPRFKKDAEGKEKAIEAMMEIVENK